jgi:hypothetical protein
MPILTKNYLKKTFISETSWSIVKKNSWDSSWKKFFFTEIFTFEFFFKVTRVFNINIFHCETNQQLQPIWMEIRSAHHPIKTTCIYLFLMTSD